MGPFGEIEGVDGPRVWNLEAQDHHRRHQLAVVRFDDRLQFLDDDPDFNIPPLNNAI